MQPQTISRTNVVAVQTIALFSLISFASTAQTARAQASASVALKVSGNVTTPLQLSLADLKSMPRRMLKVMNPHERKMETYEGVPLQNLLREAGVPQGEALRGRAMTTYVLAEAADGYRVIFSLAELDSGFTDSDVIVADSLDGAPLGPKQGPLKLVVPHDKRPARWVRMLKSLTVSQASP
jgi:DMSO/TMAO reductase YedYZ molybdopterin-dependent catalytic subunit